MTAFAPASDSPQLLAASGAPAGALLASETLHAGACSRGPGPKAIGVAAFAPARAYVRRRCARGEAVEFRQYPDSGHVNVIGAAGDAALAWTEDRLARKPAPTGCAAAG